MFRTHDSGITFPQYNFARVFQAGENETQVYNLEMVKKRQSSF